MIWFLILIVSHPVVQGGQQYATAEELPVAVFSREAVCNDIAVLLNDILSDNGHPEQHYKCEVHDGKFPDRWK